MKIKKYSWLAVLPMIFTACQDDVLVENLQTDKLIYTLSANVGEKYADSRAQIQLNNPLSGEEFFFWNEKDSFILYQDLYDDLYNMNKSVFNISEDYTEPTSGSALNATFHTKNPVFPNMDYYAVYPYSAKLGTNDRMFDFTIGNNSQTTALFFDSNDPKEVWKEYFKNNMFMMKKGRFDDVENPSVSFEHLCALARVTYVNKTEKTQDLYSCQLYGVMSANSTQQQFGSDLNYDTLDDSAYGSGASACVHTKYLKVAVGDTIDFYMLFFPKEFANDDDVIRLVVDDYPSGYGSLDLTVADFKAANPGDTGFVAGKRYWFKVTDTPQGMVWTKDYNKANNSVKFTNKELSKALYNYLEQPDKMPGAVTFDADSCAVMSKEDVTKVTELNFNDMVVTSLDGIEEFENLATFYCNNTGLLSCDLNQNKALSYLELNGQSDLKEFVLNNHDNIGSVYLQNCSNLENVELKNNPKLATASCINSSKLNRFILDGSSTLGVLDYSSPVLESFSVSNPSNIYWLRCAGSTLPSNLEEFVRLEILNCQGVGDRVIDNIPTGIKAQLVELDCSDNQLTELKLTEFSRLRMLRCRNNALTELDLTSCKDLEEIELDGNNLTCLDASGLKALRMLFVNKNQLVSLKVAECEKIDNIQCHSNKMTQLDLSDCSSLQYVLCGRQSNANEGKMSVKLHDALKEKWENDWSHIPDNEGATSVDTLPEVGGDTGGDTITNAATGGASAGNFTNQGVF